MAFYVPVGPRGLIFRFGTVLIGVLGSIAYWRASRRRPAQVPGLPFSFDGPDA